MPTDLELYLPDNILDFDRLRNELATGAHYAPSFGRRAELKVHIDMLEHEFSGQHKIKLAHAILNVFLRRGIETDTVYRYFRELWSAHGDILIETLDSRWLVSACDSICDHTTNPVEAREAILLSLFVNTVKLSETERRMMGSPDADASRIRGRTPLFDGLTAFMPGGGDMLSNLFRRLETTLQPNTLTGVIGRELICRMMSDDTLFTRFSRKQIRNRWNFSLKPTALKLEHRIHQPKRQVIDPHRVGYILLNDTGRLGNGFHLGTVAACTSIRQHLERRGLQEIGWANERAQFDALLDAENVKPALVVLNGEGTMHHNASRARELLAICSDAKRKGMGVAVINSVWEANSQDMATSLREFDRVYVRDSVSLDALPTGFPANVVPDVSIPMFLNLVRDGQFAPAQHEICVMDSVVPAAWKALLQFAEEKALPFYAMPGPTLQTIRNYVIERTGFVRPRLLQLPDIMSSKAWVTGRFHGLIAAFCAGSHVCAVRSNTAKIEGLLKDADLADACLLGPEWIAASTKQKHEELLKRFEMQQSSRFEQRRTDFLEASVEHIEEMFDSVASLGNRHSNS